MKQDPSFWGWCKVICCPVQAQEVLSFEELEDSHVSIAPWQEKPVKGPANENGRCERSEFKFSQENTILWH